MTIRSPVEAEITLGRVHKYRHRQEADNFTLTIVQSTLDDHIFTEKPWIL
jgi:hypothetical protein